MTRYDDDYNYVDTMVMTVATSKTTTVTPVCNLSLSLCAWLHKTRRAKSGSVWYRA